MVMATGSSTPHTLLSRIFSRAELQTAISATSGITSKLRRIAVNFGRTNTADKEKANGTKLAVRNDRRTNRERVHDETNAERRVVI
jgi:hypothetical protein